MKHCSQCGFTFGENEQFCDFDGTELNTVPEPAPFSPSASTLRALRPSRFRRLALSRVSLAALMLAGLISSALLIGYYDSGSQSNIEIASRAQTQNDMVNLVPQGPSETSDQAKPEQAKPRSISTQRRIAAAAKTSSMPSSMLRWESAASHSSRPRPGPSRSKREAIATFGMRARKQTRARDDRESLAQGRRRSSAAGVVARNQKRQRSHERGVQRRSATEVANRRRGRESDSSREQNESNVVAISRGRESDSSGQQEEPNVVAISRGRAPQNSRQQKESKLVAILKKTGSILTRPFKW